MTHVSNTLASEIGSVNPNFKFGPVGLGQTADFQTEIAKLAQEKGYTPNFAAFDCKLDLRLMIHRESKIIISFHGFGQKYRGLVAVAVFFQQQGGPMISATDDIFQVNYREEVFKVSQRLEAWLDRALAQALVLWRKTF